MSETSTRALAVTRPRRNRLLASIRRDPLLWAGVAVALATVGWATIPTASSVLNADTSSQIRLDVPIQVAVLPGVAAGDAKVQLPDLAIPGRSSDVTSSGWKMTTNWANGYRVRIRSTTSPSLRGANAAGGGADGTFKDFKTDAACPCPWDVRGFEQGVFGYSATIGATNGPAPQDVSKWGSAGALRWRGLNNSSFQLFETPGGSGTYTADLHFRTAIPVGTAQPEGLYRASVIVSVDAKL